MGIRTSLFSQGPSDLPHPDTPHLLTAHELLNSSIDEPSKNYSVPIIQSLSRCLLGTYLF